jgi:signal transduction histidine kinase/DNA-binding response OmpR family regulator
MKMQAERLISQQKDIEARQKILDQQIIISRNQSTVIIIIALTLSLALIFGGLSYYFLKENGKITGRLEVQNREISAQKNQLEEQKNQLIAMSAKAEEAHQAKLNFFTNISHEFRTPLTLILSPLEELVSNPKLNSATRQTLQLVEKNVLRLYRLVNQLMDFRKVEFNKMQVKASENDLVNFIKDIVGSYEGVAKNKNISLNFLTAERKLPVWFDVAMMDKVIFNLLSNAFKFTKEGGFIHVSLLKYETSAVVKIEDSGVGMSKDAIQHAFEPFFQGEYENYKGTGLGLALSKELIELHNGSITVKSEKGKGTEFEIQLPLTNEYENTVAAPPATAENFTPEDARMYITDLYDKITVVNEVTGPAQKKYSVLVIEDNPDLRQYLKKRLSANYDVLEAGDANTALQETFNNAPDIIICDVVIPGKNGLELTRLFKTDVRTAHIPVILLTARSEEDQKIEGLKTGADAYVTKPFNFTLLDQQINSLLLNRNKSKEHYSSEISQAVSSMVVKKNDRKFISDFKAIVENNISNDHFSIENICRELSISHVQLSRKVKALLNCNVNDYIISIRLQKAKYYLQHENLSISEVAFKTGFSSATYFSTVFKTKLSETPSDFKERVKQ